MYKIIKGYELVCKYDIGVKFLIMSIIVNVYWYYIRRNTIEKLKLKAFLFVLVKKKTIFVP